MTRKTAQDILVAGLGQMISIEEITCRGHRMCRLSRLQLVGPMEYSLEFIIERTNWYEVVAYLFPEIKDEYEQQFDFIKPGYLDRLATQRKAGRFKQKNSGSIILSDNLQSRNEDN